MAYTPLGEQPKKSGGSAPAESSGGYKPLGSTGTATAKKSSKGFLGVNLPKLPLVHVDLPAIGVTTDKHNPVTQVANLVKGAGPGLVRLGGTLLSEAKAGHAQGGLIGRLSGGESVGSAINPLSKESLDLARERQPVTYQLLKSPVQTVRQVPDTALAVRPGGPGFGQSDLGKQIREEGVLGTALAKVADVSMLAGGAGLLGKGAGVGKLAEAQELERLASGTAAGAGLKAADEFTLAKAAMGAEAGGDIVRATDLAKAADQMSRAGRLRAEVAAAGTGERIASKVTAGAARVGHLGGRVAAAPFIPTEKALSAASKGVGLLAKSGALAPYVERAGEALGRANEKKIVGDVYHENVRARYQGKMHALFERHGLEKVARNLSDDEQAAVYLVKEGQLADPAVRRLMATIDTLPDEARPDAVRALFPHGDVTAEQLSLAQRFREGALPEKQQAKLQDASDRISAAQGEREAERYVTGRGTSTELSDAALEARRQRARGESADMDVARAVEDATGATRARLADIRSEMDALNTAGPAEPVPMSLAQERQMARDAERTRAAQKQGQAKLEKQQSAERARRDRFERENQVRADRADQKRFEQLQEQEAAALDKLAQQTEEARNSVAAAPPQDRPALIVGQRARQLALDLAEAHPERASEFAALADDIVTTKAALDKAGIKTEYFFGGAEREKLVSPPPTAKLRRPVRLQSERNRTSGVLPRNVRAQAEKYAEETLGILHNEFRGTLQRDMGSTVAAELGLDARVNGRPAFHGGADLVAQLGEHDLVAWEPKTGKLLDAADVTPESAVLPRHLYDALTAYTKVSKPGSALKAYDWLTGQWKHSVLALSPRWHVGNIIGNAALATIGAGLSPAEIAANIGQARRLVKEFEGGGKVPAEHEAAMERLIAAGYHNPDLGNATARSGRLSRAVEGSGESAVRGKLAHPLSTSYTFNEYVDSVNRTMVYLAKHKKGYSADAAVQLALKAAGDFNKMTPFERNFVRRVIPFYAWQRHITRLALSLPIEAPARVAWTLHLADLEQRVNPDPGAANEFNQGTIPIGGKRLNVNQFFPFSSSFWTDPTFRGAGYQFNPVLKAAVAGGTGYNLGKMKPVSGRGIHTGTNGKDNPSGYGAAPTILAAKNPAAFAAFLAQQFPQVGAARDLVAGNAPVRYDTGEPRKVGPGATKKNAKPTLTGRGRTETLARLLGVPLPEPEQRQTTKKR